MYQATVMRDTGSTTVIFDADKLTDAMTIGYFKLTDKVDTPYTHWEQSKDFAKIDAGRNFYMLVTPFPYKEGGPGNIFYDYFHSTIFNPTYLNAVTVEDTLRQVSAIRGLQSDMLRGFYTVEVTDADVKEAEDIDLWQSGSRALIRAMQRRFPQNEIRIHNDQGHILLDHSTMAAPIVYEMENDLEYRISDWRMITEKRSGFTVHFEDNLASLGF